MPNVLSAERQVLAPDPRGGSTGGFLRFTERRIAVARLPATAGRNHAVADHDSSLSARLPSVREERGQADGPQEPLAAYDSWSFNRLACVGAILAARIHQIRRRVPSVGTFMGAAGNPPTPSFPLPPPPHPLLP